MVEESDSELVLRCVLRSMLHRYGVAIGATEAAAFAVRPENGSAEQLRLIAHLRPDASPPEQRAAARAAFETHVSASVAANRDAVISVRPADDRGLGQYLII